MKQPKHDQYPICPVCKKLFTFNKRRTNYYCSDACKQRAYRDRHGLSAFDKEEHYRRVIETKRSQDVNVRCAWCERSFTVDQTRASTMYCSAACKQKAYRDQKRQKDAITARYLEMCHIDSWSELYELLQSLEREYFNKWGHNWNLIDCTVRVKGVGAYLDKDGQTIVWFQDKERATRFLAGYLANGRPNYAETRQR